MTFLKKQGKVVSEQSYLVLFFILRVICFSKDGVVGNFLMEHGESRGVGIFLDIIATKK